MFDRFRHRFLGWWSRLVSRRPGWVLFVATAVAVASVAVAYGQLRFESDRNALVDADLPWNQRFQTWREQFPNTDELVVVVDAYGGADEHRHEARRRAERLVDEIGPRLEASDAVLEAVWGFDSAAVHPRAIRLEPMPAFERRLAELRQARPLLASATASAFLDTALARLRGSDEPPALEDQVAGLEQFRRAVEAFTHRLEAPPDEPMDLGGRVAGPAELGGWRYLRSENERLLLVRVTPRVDREALNPHRAAIAEVRAILDDAQAAHSEVELGLTGNKVIAADETATATRDSTLASLVAVALIAIVLITAFHSLRVPIMLIIALGLGIGWSFGFLTLAIGHLQVISVVFVVLLLGLGIAFGIHLASGFELVRHAFPDTRAGFRNALQQTLETVGPGLVTGAVTTAAAFATTVFTEFRGVAEMGMIAGVGVLLCLVAMCSVYPALLRLLKPRHHHFRPMEARRIHLFEPHWVMPFVRRPRATLTVAGLVVLLSLGAITQMRFDYNLMALLPREVESVEWQRRLVEQGGQSIWSVTSITSSLDEARERAERFRALPDVESVGGVAMLFPAQAQQRRDMIDQARRHMGENLQRALDADEGPRESEAASLIDRANALRFALAFGSWGAPPEVQTRLGELQGALAAFTGTLEGMSAERRAEAVAALECDYQSWRQEVAQLIEQALSHEAVQPDDLPSKLLAPYFGRAADGSPRYAMEVYPRLPEGVEDALEPPFLGRFVNKIYEVDDQVTGSLVQVYESGTLIWVAYLWAGVYALAAVFLIVAIDFQSLRDAALALVPVATGFSVTFAVMYLVGLNINAANIMVLPLMFGIGVDAGVHVLHRYRQSPHHQPPGLTAGTGKGVTLTSLTTMIGFGALMLASHRGIAGLGFVLTVGIGMTMLACWSVMPAWLELRNQRHRRRRGDVQPASASMREPVRVG